MQKSHSEKMVPMMDRANLDNLTDEELVLRAAAGDKDAEELLVRRYNGLVYRRARPYFLPGADQEDLLQEGMIGLCEAIRSFDSEKYPTFSTFASVCIMRQILSAVKSYNRQKHLPLNTSLSLFAPMGEDGELTLVSFLTENSEPSLEETFILREEHTHLQRRMSELLSPLEKQVCLLYLQGQRYADIAHALGKSVSSVDSTIQRIRRKLQQALDEGKDESGC